MRQWFYILFYCALATTAARGATTVPGGFVTNETWTVEGSPYRLTGDVIVPEGSYLNIESGTEVIADFDIDQIPVGYIPRTVELIVRGLLQCVASQNTNRVIFRGARAAIGAWHGIVIESTNRNLVLENLHIRDALRGLQIDTRFPLTPTIRNLLITKCEEGIVVRNGYVPIDRVEIFGCTNGISGGGRFRLSNSLIHGNKHYGLLVSSASIVNCTIHGNLASGVLVFDFLELANSLVTGNGNYGVTLLNLPDDQPIAVHTYSILWGNRNGAFSTPNLPIHIGSDPQYMDSLGPDGLSGTGDEDFSLRATSPAIDAGENESGSGPADQAGRPRYVDDPSIPDRGDGTAPVIDIGAYEFQPPLRFTTLQRTLDGTMMLSFNTIPSVVYALEGSEDLRTWSTLPGPVDGTGTIVTLQLTENLPMRFFRVRTL
jgi:hypothetical protein